MLYEFHVFYVNAKFTLTNKLLMLTKLKKNLSFTLTSTKLSMLLATYYVVVLNYPFYNAVLTLPEVTFTLNNLYILTFPLVIFLVLQTFFKLLLIPGIHKLIIPIILLISSAIFYYEVSFKIFFDPDMLTNTLQTNQAEASRLITYKYCFWLLIFGVIPAFLYIRTKVIFSVWYIELLKTLSFIIVSSIGILIIAGFSYKDYASFFRNNDQLHYLILPANFIVSGFETYDRYVTSNIEHKQIGLNAVQKKTYKNNHVLVLIVGETTRAKNWGLNGYAKQTTPLLAKRNDLINYKDVYSCGTATAVSLPCLFSHMERKSYDRLTAHHTDNLIDILQRANIDILWIDNDLGCKEVCERVEYVNMTVTNDPKYCTKGECLDEIMLEPFMKKLKSITKDTVIVLHTIGSHGPTYNERYTKEFKQFTPTCETNAIQTCTDEEISNTYDNGILYIDNFINTVIETVDKEKDIVSSVVYFSDHGESLGENGIYLHGAPYMIAPEVQKKIPMVIWSSKINQVNTNIDMSCLTKNASTKPYSHDNIFHSLLTLMDIDTDKIPEYNKTLDIFNECKKDDTK